VVGRTVLALALLLSGCWKLELGGIADNVLEFEPAAGAPPGWLVESVDASLDCPDGSTAAFYVVYPPDAGDEPLPVAVLYHAGAFDFVLAPDAEDPLAGTHFSEPSRLDGTWALRQVFVTLGMYPDPDPLAVNTGLLPALLAENGVAMVIPTNCWGDMWHNRPGFAENQFSSDFFLREGRAAAEWSYRAAVDPLFADALSIELPFTPDVNQVYVIGLGEGGRAVGELLALDSDDDGTPDFKPAGALVDAWGDDLRVYFADPTLYGNRVAGLSRIFPGGASETVSGSLFDAPLPDRFGYVYSTADAEVPNVTHDAVLDRLAGRPEAWVHRDDGQIHVQLNGYDRLLTEDAVEYLIEGDRP
jgi:hypothetical protein